jgi:hypothetical protein
MDGNAGEITSDEFVFAGVNSATHLQAERVHNSF